MAKVKALASVSTATHEMQEGQVYNVPDQMARNLAENDKVQILEIEPTPDECDPKHFGARLAEIEANMGIDSKAATSGKAAAAEVNQRLDQIEAKVNSLQGAESDPEFAGQVQGAFDALNKTNADLQAQLQAANERAAVAEGRLNAIEEYLQKLATPAAESEAKAKKTGK